MNVIGERVLFFGDSLSHPGPDAGPSIVDITRSIGVVSGAPGELIARQLLAAGAQAVRVNAKKGRSARSFLLSEGGTSLLARDQNEFRPTKVVIWLGTNDIDRGLTPDALAKTAAAMAQIRDTYRAMGAEVFALGPPSYPNAKYNNAAPIMLDTIRGVFGADHTFDIRPLTTGAPRAGDGIHFTAVGAAAAATPIVQMLTAPSTITVAQTGMSRGTKIALGVLGAAGFVGLSWLALRVAKRAAVRSVGQRQPLGAVDEKLIQRIAQALSYEVPVREIRDRFVDEGYSEEDVYLAYKAAQMYLKHQDEPLPHERQLGALPATKTEFRKRFKQALQASEWQGDPTRGISGKYVAVGDSGWEVRRVYSQHRFGYKRLFNLRKIGHGRSSTQESVDRVTDTIFKGEIPASWVDEGKLGLLGALPTTLKKTYVVVSSRLVRGPRGARVGYEAQLIQPGAPVLFNLFQLSKLNPDGTRNYPQLQREHGDTWTAWDAGAGTVHGKVRRDTEDDATAAAIALARKRGYVIVDADLMRAGLPLDENAGFGAILESKYDDVAKAYVDVPITAKNKAKKILARNVEAAYYWRQHDEHADRLTEREAASVDDQIRKLERRISKIVGRL
jgi:lysophospholipase L1-like esterase